MAVFKSILLAIILVVACDAAFKHRRSPQAPQNDDDKKKPAWKPVDTPQEFSVMVDDNINKANVNRKETWMPGGVVEGEYAAPTRDGKWLKVNYRADKDGFHVVSQKVVTEEELNQPSGGAAADHQAKVQTQVNGKDINYTVKEEDLKKAKTEQKKPVQ